MKRSLGTLAVTGLLALSSIIGAAPAHAADVVSDTTVTYDNVLFGPSNACGEAGNIYLNGSIRIRIWDNGHLSVQGLVKATDLATDGSVIASQVQTYNEQLTAGGTHTVQANTTAVCRGSGVLVNLHSGFTIDANGNVHLHGA